MAQDDTRCTAFDPLAELGVREDDLQRTLISEFLTQECIVLPDSSTAFDGCGVYAIYYYGDYPRYEPISNTRHDATVPIYVGKAVPSGTRKGGAHLEPSTESKLAQRLSEHRRTIEQAENLDISNFRCRSLALGSVWIRYAEELLISTYSPWWNCYIDGFGLHDVGAGRAGSDKSVWDTLHPGRSWVEERSLESIGTPDEVWATHVAPEIEAAKQDRTYKDRRNIEQVVTPGERAPAIEETSLFDFETE